MHIILTISVIITTTTTTSLLSPLPYRHPTISVTLGAITSRRAIYRCEPTRFQCFASGPNRIIGSLVRALDGPY